MEFTKVLFYVLFIMIIAFNCYLFLNKKILIKSTLTNGISFLGLFLISIYNYNFKDSSFINLLVIMVGILMLTRVKRKAYNVYGSNKKELTSAMENYFLLNKINYQLKDDLCIVNFNDDELEIKVTENKFKICYINLEDNFNDKGNYEKIIVYLKQYYKRNKEKVYYKSFLGSLIMTIFLPILFMIFIYFLNR